MLPRLSLSLTMLLLTTAVGFSVLATSYAYHNYVLNDIFYKNQNEHFLNHAIEYNERAQQYLNKFSTAVDIYASNISAINYMRSDKWLNNQEDSLIHEDVPDWLPSQVLMSRYILPHYAMLFNQSGQLREIYHNNEPVPSTGLLNIFSKSIEKSDKNSFVVIYDDKAYILSSEKINVSNNTSTLVIASSINSELLRQAQGAGGSKIVSALLNVDEDTVLVSTNNKLIPSGTEISTLQNDYLNTVSDNFIDSTKSSAIKLGAFISNKDVGLLIEQVLLEDRRITIFTAISYIISFALLIYWITSRIQKLNNRVIRFSKEMSIPQPNLNHNNAIDELENRFELLASAIQSETMALEHQALHDPLTNMPNRKLFNKQVQKLVSNSSNKGHHFVVIISDLDRFKEINDTLGHHIGDVVLQKVADRLHETLRSDDMVARLGGDEFGILLSHTTLEQVPVILDKVIKAFETPFDIEEHHLHLALSMGVVEYPLHGGDINILLKRADVAMYNAKNKRSGYSIYEASEDNHAVSRLALASELRVALNNNSLRLFYQPKINLLTGHIYGAEALLRWEHHERGFISPEDFIPLAEHTGLIQPITCWVMDNASKQCAIWNKLGHKLLISINISTSCIHDARLPVKLNEIILGNNLSPDQITLELTENIFIKDPVRSKKILDNVNKMGVSISIDDFGTGYSSLAYLKQLPVNELKVDRSFVMEMLEDENDEVIVRTTIDLAHNLGITVVAEGVESMEVAQRLKELNCDAAQGYYLGRPMEVDDFIKFIEENKGMIDLS